jgi:hypothetical protein
MAEGVFMSTHVSPIVECCIRVIQNVHSTHDLIVEAAKLIVADAEASHRFYDLKASADQDRLIAYPEGYERLADSLLTTYSHFESDPHGGGAALLKEVLATRQRLSESP